MFHHSKHKRKKFLPTTQLSIARLIQAIGLAGIDTIWAIYMNSFGLSISQIGFISAILVILTLIASFYSTPILEKLREFKVLILSLIIIIISYISIAFTNNLYLFLIFSAILVISSVFRINSFDILFRDEEKDDSKLNEDEGLLYTLINIGWLIGPLIAGFVLVTYNMQAVFISSSIFIVITLLILLTFNLKLPKKEKEKKLDINIILNIKEFIKTKKLYLPYLVALGIEIWWALIYIYVPLFIINKDLGNEIVGIFLSAVIVPLILFEFKAGKLVNKYGFKKLIVLGFFFLTIISIFAFFSNNIYLTLLLLILGSIFMAFIEPLQDSYFFKQVKGNQEEKFYPIFATSGDIGSLISKFSIAAILLFLPENFAYLIISIFMGLIGINCLKIKN